MKRGICLFDAVNIAVAVRSREIDRVAKFSVIAREIGAEVPEPGRDAAYKRVPSRGVKQMPMSSRSADPGSHDVHGVFLRTIAPRAPAI